MTLRPAACAGKTGVPGPAGCFTLILPLLAPDGFDEAPGMDYNRVRNTTGMFHVEHPLRGGYRGQDRSSGKPEGGVGKTTTAVNLSACVAALGKKVLIVDLDPQGNSTTGYGISKRSVEMGTYEVLIGEAEARSAIRKTDYRPMCCPPTPGWPAPPWS